MLQEMLKFMGVGNGRLRLEYIATSESDKLSRVFSSFTEDIRNLGPSPLKRKVSVRG